MSRIRASQSDEAKRAVTLLDECKTNVPTQYHNIIEALIDIGYVTGIVDGGVQSRKIFDHSLNGLRLDCEKKV